jgi:hypothetical protein
MSETVPVHHRVNMPKPFDGSDAEARGNFKSHQWIQVDEDEVVCFGCDSKHWHKAAFYPCGTRVPRLIFEFDKEGDLIRCIEE